MKNIIQNFLITLFILLAIENETFSQCGNANCPAGFVNTACITGITNAPRYGCNGSVTFMATHNYGSYLAGYLVSINGSALTGNSYGQSSTIELPAGNYTAKVYDSNYPPDGDCTVLLSFSISQPLCNITTTSIINAAPVYGCNNNTGSVSITGLTNACSGYEIFVDGLRYASLMQSGESLVVPGLAPGNHIVQTYSVPAGCETTGTINIPLPVCDIVVDNLSITAASNSTCSGGSISLVATTNDCSGFNVIIKSAADNSVIYAVYSNPSGQSVLIPGLVAGNYIVEVKGASPGSCYVPPIPITIGCTNVITCNFKLLLQGYYIGAGSMQAVMSNQAVPQSLISVADMITIELHDPITYALVASEDVLLSTNGLASATFTKPPGSYYIAIKHRNSIQTWSAAPVACTSSTALYDFTTAASNAMGDNQIQIEAGLWAFFTGDLNQDDYIDGNDFPQYDLESASGGLYDGIYTVCDMNGDGFVDGNDFPVFDMNSSNSVSAIHP